MFSKNLKQSLKIFKTKSYVRSCEMILNHFQTYLIDFYILVWIFFTGNQSAVTFVCVFESVGLNLQCQV